MVYDVNGNAISSDGSSFQMPFSPILGTNFLIRHYGGNSSSNFSTAVTNGYVATEGDVRFTSDSVPIMSHDSALNGLTIANSTLAQLQNAGTVYTFDNWMLDSKKANLFADIDFTKTYTEPQCEILVDHIIKSGMIGRCSIECGRASSAPNLVKYSENLILNVLGGNTKAIIDEFEAVAEKCRMIICTTPVEYATAEILAYAHEKGYMAKIWNSSDSVTTTRNYLNMGADQVIVDTTKPSDL